MLDYFRPRAKEKLLRGEPVPWIDNHKRARYVRQCVLSFPPWVNRRALKALWHECRLLESIHKEPYSLDHIVPLNHPLVCGLTVPDNLRCAPARVNGFKGNKYHFGQLELFEDNEQLELRLKWIH